MISKLKGKVDFIRDKYAVIEVAGVGYQVLMTEVGLAKIAKGEKASLQQGHEGEVELFIHTHVREDQLALFGFETLEELEMFEMLLSVNGIGPRAALAILTIATPALIKKAIVEEDASVLTQVSGVGKKTAERVILDLKNKIDELPAGEGEVAQAGQDVIEALLAMGYKPVEAREALRTVPPEVKDESEIIKLALRAMKK